MLVIISNSDWQSILGKQPTLGNDESNDYPSKFQLWLFSMLAFQSERNKVNTINSRNHVILLAGIFGPDPTLVLLTQIAIPGFEGMKLRNRNFPGCLLQLSFVAETESRSFACPTWDDRSPRNVRRTERSDELEIELDCISCITSSWFKPATGWPSTATRRSPTAIQLGWADNACWSTAVTES